jgi:hypothetical protein
VADEGSLGSVLAALFGGGGPWGIPAQKPPLASLPGAAPAAVPFASMPGQDAFEAAAARLRAPYAKANERESGLPQIGEYFGNKLKSALTAPRDAFTGAMQVNDPETGMPSAEAMQRGQGVANLAMTSGIPMAQRGAAGIFGGKLANGPPAPSNMNTPKGAPANNNLNVSNADLLANVIPPPLSTMERTWQNYTKRMTPEEMLQSEAVWGGARNLSEQEGIKEYEAFANLANDYYGRKGINQFMTPEAARKYMAKERGIGVVPDKGS